MNTIRKMKPLVVGFATSLLVSGGLGLAGLGLAVGTAHAGPNGGPYQWCPGQSPHLAGIDVTEYSWDLNVCHTFYSVSYGLGNVPYRFGPTTSIWEGDNPPAPTYRGCPPICIY
jgi:hypothetical protein